MYQKNLNQSIQVLDMKLHTDTRTVKGAFLLAKKAIKNNTLILPASQSINNQCASSKLASFVAVGRRNPFSNLIPVFVFNKLNLKKNDTREYRGSISKEDNNKRYNVQLKCEEFWAMNNARFNDGLAELEKKNPANSGNKESNRRRADFYKSYIEAHTHEFSRFNRWWWKTNFNLLWHDLNSWIYRIRI